MLFRFEVNGDAYSSRGKRGLSSARGALVLCGVLLASALAGFVSIDARAQQGDSATPPVVVQPGAPGKPSKTLPPSTRAALPPLSQADVEFMQGMIMHHAQAVEMTALIPSHTENTDVRSLGARISRSQSDEIKFMRRWLASRGEATSMEMAGMSATADKPATAGESATEGKSATPDDAPGHAMAPMAMAPMAMALMPGMLTPGQMDALRNAKGAEFNKLFLAGMIQHHNGALIMVKDLFDTAGAGQDAELFDFATDVDSGQRAEIRIMQSMLEKKSSKEK